MITVVHKARNQMESVSRRGADLESPTHWTRLVARDATGGELERCWSYFYRRYKGAAFGYFRRRGFQAEDAADLVGDFFAAAMERELLERADPERGRFRPYFFLAVERFLTDHRRSAGRKRRRPARPVQAIDRLEDSHWARVEPEAPGESPERAFDRDWAEALVRSSLERLRSEYEKRKMDKEFEAFVLRTLDGLSTREIAERTGLDPSKIDPLCYRGRRKLREILRQEVNLTVRDEEIGDELRYLMTLFDGA